MISGEPCAFVVEIGETYFGNQVEVRLGVVQTKTVRTREHVTRKMASLASFILDEELFITRFTKNSRRLIPKL